MYYTRSFVAKKAIIAHPIKKVKSSFFNQLGDICYYHRMCQKRRPAPGGLFPMIRPLDQAVDDETRVSEHGYDLA